MPYSPLRDNPQSKFVDINLAAMVNPDCFHHSSLTLDCGRSRLCHSQLRDNPQPKFIDINLATLVKMALAAFLM